MYYTCDATTNVQNSYMWLGTKEYNLHMERFGFRFLVFFSLNFLIFLFLSLNLVQMYEHFYSFHCGHISSLAPPAVNPCDAIQVDKVESSWTWSSRLEKTAIHK